MYLIASCFKIICFLVEKRFISRRLFLKFVPCDQEERHILHIFKKRIVYGSESRLKTLVCDAVFQRVPVFRVLCFVFFVLYFCELFCPQGLHFYKKNKKWMLDFFWLFCHFFFEPGL